MSLYLGCPIWGSKRWVGSLFPPKSQSSDFLHLYGQRFLTVEGNTSFYGMPDLDRMSRWRDETPPGFRFCFKFPQEISHALFLEPQSSALSAWIDRLYALSDRAGPSFLQLPAQYGPNRFDELAAFLTRLPRDLRFAVEVRHPGFFLPPFEKELNDLLESLHMARVLYDVRGLRGVRPMTKEVRDALKQKPQVPVRFTKTADFLFVRYISHPEVEKNAPLFDEWVRWLTPWLLQGREVYFFMHHIDDFYMPALCKDFWTRLSSIYPLPPPPFLKMKNLETAMPKLPVQGSLF